MSAVSCHSSLSEAVDQIMREVAVKLHQNDPKDPLSPGAKPSLVKVHEHTSSGLFEWSLMEWQMPAALLCQAACRRGLQCNFRSHLHAMVKLGVAVHTRLYKQRSSGGHMSQARKGAEGLD